MGVHFRDHKFINAMRYVHSGEYGCFVLVVVALIMLENFHLYFVVSVLRFDVHLLVIYCVCFSFE